MRKPLRALVIEDLEFDAALLVNLLRHGGYEVGWKRVDTADGMRQALKEEKWDIVLSDHEMPAFSAPEALQLLQATGQDLPFIIVSGGIGEATAVALMKAGAHDFLMKGHLGRLVPAVERELREAANREARRQAERFLRESETRYRLLWENSPDAIVVMDAEGTIAFANPAVQAAFGYPPTELVGQNFTVLQAPQGDGGQRPGLYCAWSPGPTARSPVMEFQGRHRDGREVIAEIGFSEMQIEGRGWFLAFIRDITQRRQAEQALRKREEEIRVAREIQHHLFPKSAPACPGYDIAGASHPAQEAGGDYFDYLSMSDGGLGVVIGDVSGHGMGPALIMAETRAYLRIVALSRLSPAEVLTRANRVLAEDLDGDRFVTVLLARLEGETRRLVYANAGHPAGYILDAEGRVKVKLKRLGAALGMVGDATYTNAPEVQLETGDLLLLLTDGIEEAEAPDGAFFGTERALGVARASRHKPAREIVEALHRAVQEFTQWSPQQDDITLVVVKVLPSGTAA